MNLRSVDLNEGDDDLVVNDSTVADSSVDLERLSVMLPVGEPVATLERSLDRELGAPLDLIRRPAPGSVGFVEWVKGEQTLTAARAAFAAGDPTKAGERLDRAERSFVRAGSPVDAAAVSLERAALAALSPDPAVLAEIAQRAEFRLLTDLPVGLRAALQMLIRTIKTDYATPGLTAVLAEYGHMVRNGITVATRFDRPRPIPLLLEDKAPDTKALPKADDGEGEIRLER